MNPGGNTVSIICDNNRVKDFTKGLHMYILHTYIHTLLHISMLSNFVHIVKSTQNNWITEW